MPKYQASMELLAPRKDVWAFLAEPHHMADWWPGIQAVQPDRRGFAPGARWRVTGDNRPSLTRKAFMTGALLVKDVQEPELASWYLTGERFDVEIRLEEAAADRTLATLTVQAPFWGALRRTHVKRSLRRLYDLCQTAADV